MKNFKEFIEEIGFTNDDFLNTGVVDLMVKLQIDYEKYVKLNLPVVGVTLNASFKKGDKVIYAPRIECKIVSEVQKDVWKVVTNDLFIKYIKTEALELATKSV